MSLILPSSTRPSNLHLTPDQIHWELDGDTLAWCENLPLEVEDGHRLFVLIHKDHDKPFVIMEKADDGTEMFVMRADHLGGDTYQHLRRLRFVPLEKRVEECDKIAAAWEEEHKETELNRLYENVGGPMLRQLDKDGFLSTSRGTSYPLVPKRTEGYGT